MGDLIIIYPKPHSIYLRGTVELPHPVIMNITSLYFGTILGAGDLIRVCEAGFSRGSLGVSVFWQILGISVSVYFGLSIWGNHEQTIF